jgi:hypothetical protein
MELKLLLVCVLSAMVAIGGPSMIDVAAICAAGRRPAVRLAPPWVPRLAATGASTPRRWPG